MVKWVLVVALVSAQAIIAAPADAAAVVDAVPAAKVQIGTFYEPFSGSAKNKSQRSAGTVVNGPVQATAQQGTLPFVSVTLGLGADDFIASATSTLTYSFLLSGSGTDAIPIHALVTAFTRTNSSDYDVSANVGFVNLTSSGGIGLRGNDMFNGVIDFFATPGDLTTVTLTATGSLVCCDDRPGSSVSAYADPYFYIDPGYLAAHPGTNLSLAFSNGVGNADPRAVAAVPEPATWTLLLAGFGLIGGALRRRPRRGSAAFA